MFEWYCTQKIFFMFLILKVFIRVLLTAIMGFFLYYCFIYLLFFCLQILRWFISQINAMMNTKI